MAKITPNNKEQILYAVKLVRQRALYRIIVILVLAGICIFTMLLSISIGTVKISIHDVVRAIFSDTEGINREIIWNIRFPRTLVGALVGICLALSGAILQGIMRNPLASPTIIGVSSGAGVAAIAVTIVFPQLFYLITLFSFLGAFITTILVYLLAWKNGIKPMRLILAGIAVASFLGAITNTIMIFYPDKVQGVINFMVGGLNARTWKHFYIIWPYALTGFILVNIFAKRLNILMLGDDVAVGLGIKVEQTRLILIAIAALLAASAVSIVGLLGFVGLIVPHITRLIIGSDYRYLFPATAFMGAGLLMLCDIIARIAFDPIEIPVGIIMALLGAPFFLYLLRSRLHNEN